MAKDKKTKNKKPEPAPKSKKKTKTSTQKRLDIAEIKENTVIMKDGTLRSVLLISSINFSLKSEDEQNAIIAVYVNFLNTLDFPMQILVLFYQSVHTQLSFYILDAIISIA